MQNPANEVSGKKRYHIRFNAHHSTSDRPELVWGVFEDGVEHLVKQIEITAKLFGECTEEFGVKKWNIACVGNMTIVDDVAIIV